MSGGAPALDSEGNMFMSTGNGTFSETTVTTKPPLSPNNNFGESFINLSPTTLAVQDFYTPSQNADWTSYDLDLSSSGVTVLPDGVGPTAHQDFWSLRQAGPFVDDRPDEHVRIQSERRQHGAVPDAAL